MNIEDIKDIIKELELLNPIDEYAYEKAVLAFLKVKQLPVLLYRIPEGTSIFRARTQKNEGLLYKVSDISLPPNECVKEFARCNRPFQSKFYCAENIPTAYMELVEYWAETREVGEVITITLSRWVLTKSLTVVLVTTPDENNRISEFDKHHGSALDEFIERCNPEIREGTIEIYRYLFKMFRKRAKKDPKTYIITTAYSNVTLMHSKGNANGIYYPSIPFGEQGVNFALNSKFISSENMKLTSVIQNKMTVESIENGMKKFKESGIIHATGFDESKNQIKWKQSR
ncbi:hypothetical protein [Reichenbachiella sp. MALMAid0571]|uniref:hypothetical protein n=1 Tax=Reichenbachiella sp. MALMAid0571 TaxID=3143939 RepID=UPI0032DFF631